MLFLRWKRTSNGVFLISLWRRLLAALVLKQCDGFTDAQRRDYIEWVSCDKREATREKRIATTSEWISELTRCYWKYENC